MILTQDEAKTKWCPFVRLSVADANGNNASVVAINRLAIRNTSAFSTPHAAMCIGSGCMAWRDSSKPTGTISEGGVDRLDDNFAQAGFYVIGSASEAEKGRHFEAHMRANGWSKAPDGNTWVRPTRGYCGLAGKEAGR